MKRTLTIAVFCMLLLATVGTTAAVAEQKGKSPIYQFDVINGNTVAGKLVVDTTDPTAATYVFNGHGLTPGTPYYLRYTLSGATHYVGDSVVANKGGNVHMKGVWENSVDDVTGTPAPTFEVTTEAPPLPITASFTQFFEGWYRYMPPGGVAPYFKEQWTLDFSSSTGPITGVDIVPTYDYGVVPTTSLSYLPSGGGAYQPGDYAATLIIYTLIPGGAGMSSWNTPVTVKLTVSDGAGHSAISSQVIIAPYPPA